MKIINVNHAEFYFINISILIYNYSFLNSNGNLCILWYVQKVIKIKINMRIQCQKFFFCWGGKIFSIEIGAEFSITFTIAMMEAFEAVYLHIKSYFNDMKPCIFIFLILYHIIRPVTIHHKASHYPS